MNATQELDTAERLVSEIDEIDDLEGSSSEDVRRCLQGIRLRLIDWVPSVRVSVAASLLELSVPTVRDWAERGVLEEVSDASPRRIGLRSIVEVRPIMREFRSLGQAHGLVDAVQARIEDERALADPGLQRSLEEMHRGELTDVTPSQQREFSD